MAKIYYDKDCNLKLLDGKVVGILSQRDIISAYNQALEARGLKELILGTEKHA